jgi:hypothetical protein
LFHGSSKGGAVDLDEMLARAGIRATVDRYTFHADRGRVSDLVQCFTEDGVLEFVGEWTATGRDGILEQTSSVTVDTRARPHPLLRHHLASHYVELDAVTDARATTYFTAYTEIGPDHVGRYVDRLRCTDGDWLIAHRRVVVDWWAPRTLYPDEAARAAERREARAQS